MLTPYREFVPVLLLWSIFLHATGCAQTPGEADQYRAFKDQQGRTVEAFVIKVDADQVTIQRRDGREFTVAVSVFSKADQDFLRELQRAEREQPATSQSQPTLGQAAGGDWAQFRGRDGLGVSNASGIPVQWDADTNILWKKTLPGAGASSPIVYGDRIYLTCYTGYFVPGESSGSLDQLTRHLLALRLDTGEVIWDKSLPAKLPEEERIRDHGYAANSVAVDAERIYAFFGKSGVCAYNHDGSLLWQADVGSRTNGWGTAASPLLYKNLVIINAAVESESVIALDRATGEQKWKTGGIKESWNTPILAQADNGTELVLAIHGKVLGFSPDSGERLWECETAIGWYMVPSLVHRDGIVYCIGGRGGGGSLAIRTGGRGDVTKSHRLWVNRKGSNVPSPILHEGHLYWAGDANGIVYCVEAKTGNLVYEERLERAGQFYASPVLIGGNLYYPNRSGQTFVIAADPQFQLIGVNSLKDGSRFDASPAVTSDRLLIRSEKNLYCIGQ